MSPPRMSADQRRNAIIEAAIPLFAESGFDSVTTREIAAAAGVSEALLYRHFEGKQAIWEAIHAACIVGSAAPVEILRRLPDDTASLVACIYALMHQIQSQADQDHGNLCRMMCRSVLADGSFAEDFIRKSSGMWVDKMRACLAAAIDSGEVRNTQNDGELAIWLGHHLSVMLQLYSLSDRELIQYPASDESMVDRSVRFVLRGLGMTEAAIDTHFQPARLALLLNMQP